jgi:tRNA(Ile)-lysidine synthase
LAGRKKLKTFLIDRKVPSGARGGMPLLAAGGEILWVPGLFLSPSVMADAGTGGAAKIEWRPH